MEKRFIETVALPCGTFGTDKNCSTCAYANWHDKDRDGRVYCERGLGYNYSSRRNGCFRWAEA